MIELYVLHYPSSPEVLCVCVCLSVCVCVDVCVCVCVCICLSVVCKLPDPDSDTGILGMMVSPDAMAITDILRGRRCDLSVWVPPPLQMRTLSS